MNKLSILFTVSFGLVIGLTGCGRPEVSATTATAGTSLVKLNAEQISDVQQFAIDHPEDVATPPAMPTTTEAGSRGIHLRYTPADVNRLYNWAQNLYANNDPRATGVANWFNHIVAVKCTRYPGGPVCGQYGGTN